MHLGVAAIHFPETANISPSYVIYQKREHFHVDLMLDQHFSNKLNFMHHFHGLVDKIMI
jgi:hypothetical protein